MDSLKEKKLWFRAKYYGWGWYPSSFEGWFALALYVAVIFKSVLLITATHNGWFFLPILIATVLFIWLCYKKGEKPGWRWGGKEDK